MTSRLKPDQCEGGSLLQEFLEQGWCRFPTDPAVLSWVAHALPAARQAIAAPENSQWLRCGGTWHAGVNALPNDGAGALEGGPSLQGSAVEFVQHQLGMESIVWDRGQVSVCYPGYPQPMDTETDAAFRYRRDRDAAHVDGLHREGPDNRRHLREHHRFILGIPLVEFCGEASPLAVWEESHLVVRQAFEHVYQETDPTRWGEIDVTDVYRATRTKVFETCERTTIAAQPGECYLLHRLALHGASPWGESAVAGPDGRMIAYFRPDFPQPDDWLYAI